MLKEIVQRVKVAVSSLVEKKIRAASIFNGFFIYEGDLYFSAHWRNFTCDPKEIRKTFRFTASDGVVEVSEEDYNYLKDCTVIVPRRVIISPKYVVSLYAILKSYIMCMEL